MLVPQEHFFEKSRITPLYKALLIDNEICKTSLLEEFACNSGAK
jgi:hypothetical protein